MTSRVTHVDFTTSRQLTVAFSSSSFHLIVAFLPNMTPARPDFHLALSQLATTNDAPSTQDAAFLREVVDGLDIQAGEIRNQLRGLEEKLRAVERDRKFFKPMLSPVRRIPLETLGEIFALIVEMDSSLNDAAALAKISLVCESWRRAALGMPKLWASVGLDPSTPTFSYEAVVAWLDRSGTLSKSVRVEAVKCGPGGSCLGKKKCIFSKRALAKILVRTPHLQHVAISCPTANCSRNLFASLTSVHSCVSPSSWGAVGSLTILANWCEGWNESSVPSFTCLPAALTTLQLEMPDTISMPKHWDVRDIPVMPRPALKRLTSLHLVCDWGADAVFSILEHCSDLERATIDLGGAYEFGSGSDPIHEQGYAFPKLTVLKVENAQIDALDPLQHLKMPALLDLSISFGRTERWLPGIDFDGPFIDFDETTATALQLLLRGGDRTRPSILRSLRLTNGDFGNEFIVDTLGHLHFLAELTLDNVAFGRTTFTQLSSADQLPNLKSLRLLRAHTSPGKLAGLRAFVKKRGTMLEMSRCEEEDCACQGS